MQMPKHKVVSASASKSLLRTEVIVVTLGWPPPSLDHFNRSETFCVIGCDHTPQVPRRCMMHECMHACKNFLSRKRFPACKEMTVQRDSSHACKHKFLGVEKKIVHTGSDTNITSRVELPSLFLFFAAMVMTIVEGREVWWGSDIHPPLSTITPILRLEVLSFVCACNEPIVFFICSRV